MFTGTGPTQQRGAFAMPAGINPVSDARVAGGAYYLGTTVRLQFNAVLVHGNLAKAIVEALHPPIIELEIPVIAFRGCNLYNPSIVWSDLPIAMGVIDILRSAPFLEH